MTNPTELLYKQYILNREISEAICADDADDLSRLIDIERKLQDQIIAALIEAGYVDKLEAFSAKMREGGKV